MLHPTTKVQWMDVKSDKVHKDDIGKIFQMYSHRAIRTSNVSEVIFKAKYDIVKITDMYGWTDVKAIRRIVNVNGWMALGAENQQIKLSEDTLVPIYQPDAPFPGFHGETKYPFSSKKLSDIEQGDMVRIRRGKNGNGEDIEFAVVSFSGSLYIHDDEPTHGYEIITKSGFFNGNNIHLLGREQKSPL